MFYNLGADGDNHGPTEADKRKKLGFVQVTANAGDCIIMPLRLNHAVMPWLPTDRQRVVLFFTFIPYDARDFALTIAFELPGILPSRTVQRHSAQPTHCVARTSH